MSASWTAYIFAPFYTLLPKRWRQGERQGPQKYLARAAMISGIGEAAFSLVVLGAWFAQAEGIFGDAYANHLVNTTDASGSEWIFGGSVGIVSFAINPLTWLIVYFCIEGVLRAFAAMASDDVVGTLPLYLVDFAWRHIKKSKRAAPEPPLVADEITPGRADVCDLQIATCRRRETWKYPFTLRYAGAYFQVIDEKWIAAGPRPYIYSLRRLPAGEIARGLQNYDPTDLLAPSFKIQPL
jgi:hypothetical protein